jgi:dihydropteroate synthase
MIPKIKKIHNNILVGVSRKSMIYKKLSSSAEESLNGTSILNTLCILKGANFIRVHDVKEGKEVVKMINLVKNNN